MHQLIGHSDELGGIKTLCGCVLSPGIWSESVRLTHGLCVCSFDLMPTPATGADVVQLDGLPVEYSDVVIRVLAFTMLELSTVLSAVVVRYVSAARLLLRHFGADLAEPMCLVTVHWMSCIKLSAQLALASSIFLTIDT